MKDFFRNYVKPQPSKALFLEGMRQLKLPGIVYAAVMALTVLLVNMDIGRGSEYVRHYMMDISVDFAFESVVAIAVLSGFFLFGATLYLSHFLRSGKSRDFYGAAPYSFGTVWLNFAGAVYAWNLIGIAAGHLMHTVFMMFRDPKTIGLCLQAFAGNAAFSLTLFGIMTLSVTLTGRILNALATMAGLAALPSTVWAAFHSTMINFYSFFGFVRQPSGGHCPDPIAYLMEACDFMRTVYSYRDVPPLFEILCSGSAIVYDVVMGLLYLAAAVLFASVRTGDTAGKPFVNKPAHLLALLAVTLPVCCWIASQSGILGRHLVYTLSGRDVYAYGAAGLVLLCGFTVLVWLCELLFTFRLKTSVLALKYLPVPIAAAMVITGIGYLADSAEFTTKINPDQVVSFTLPYNASLDDHLAIFRMADSYGRTVTEDARFTDREVIEYAAAWINQYVEDWQENPRQFYHQKVMMGDYSSMGDSYQEYDDGQIGASSQINIRLNLKNGGSITRTVLFDQPHRDQLEKAITGDKTFMQSFLAMPYAAKLNIGMEWVGMTEDDVTAIYKSFVEEYNAMDDAQKLNFLKQELYADYNESLDNEAHLPTVSESDTTAETSDPNQKRRRTVLVSQSYRKGDYIIDQCEIIPGNSLQSPSFCLDIYGYAERHLYQSGYSFSQIFQIDAQRFPKTHALVVKRANDRLPAVLETIEDHAAEMNYLDVGAAYHGADTFTDLDFYYRTNHMTEEWVDESHEYWEEGNWDDDGNYVEYEIETVKVDSNAIVRQLLADAKATGDTVDFSKPYCILYIRANDRNRAVSGQFFVQTELRYQPVE